VTQVARGGVPRIVIAIAAGKDDDTELHRRPALGNRRYDLRLAARGALFGRWLAVALLKVRHYDGSNEFLLAGIVELDDDMIVVT
jgi:hypothetical protein